MPPKSFFYEHCTSFAFAVLVGTYFFFQPRLEPLVSLAFFAFWVFDYFCDAWITIRNSPYILRHEVNVIFAALYSRFGRGSCLVQFLVEAALVAIVPVFFAGVPGVSASSAVAAVFGASHLVAFYSNKKFMRSRQ
ncbi:MAG: hypothetical protein AB1299_02720 [Thermoproteota archaeon]|jgi:hypothetical protein